jgi:hypothetical protein
VSTKTFPPHATRAQHAKTMANVRGVWGLMGSDPYPVTPGGLRFFKL